MARLHSAMYVAAIICLSVCPCGGQGAATNNTAATELDRRIQCLNGSGGWSGECYDAAVITLKDETKLRDHCATGTELSPNLESVGCNSTVVEEIFLCLCPNATPSVRKPATSSVGAAESATTLSISSADYMNTTDVDALTTVDAVENFTDFVHALNVSDACEEAVLNITASPASSLQLCLKLREDSASLANRGCSPADYKKISSSVCLSEPSTTHSTPTVGTTQREAVTWFAKIVVNATLQNRIWSYVNLNLSHTCRYSIRPRVPEKITDLRRPCKMFRQSGEALIANRVCSGEEVTTLTNIFCYGAFHGTQIPATEDGRKELAFFLIAHGLTQDCHNVMQPQVEQFQESIAKGCELLTAAKDLLVQTGMCTELDIAKLDPVVCYVEPHEDNSTTLSPDGQKHRDRMENLVKQLSENCSGDIHSRFREILESRSEDTCHVVSESHDAIVRNSSCTEQELSSLSISVCAAGSKVVVISLVVLLVCLLLSAVDNGVFS